MFEIAKLIVLLSPILESSVLNGNNGGEYNGLYNCYLAADYTYVDFFQQGQQNYLGDFFCCKCISIYRLAPEFKDDLLQYVRAGGKIDIEAMHCQKSLVSVGHLRTADWKDFLESDKELATQKDDDCPSSSINYNFYLKYYYSDYSCNSDGSMSIRNIYGSWTIAKHPESQEIRVTSPSDISSGQQFEVLTNHVFSDDFQLSQYCISDDKLKNSVPLVVAPNHSFANGAHICNERLWLALDEPQFDPVILIGTYFLQPTIDGSCEAALKKLKEDTSSNYQCIKDSKKVLLRVKEKSLSILNVIVLDFSQSNLRALGSSIYFDPEDPPLYNELCSSSGENLSDNGHLDYAAIEFLLNEEIHSVKEAKEGSEEIYYSAEIVIHTHLTDEEPKKRVCLAPRIESLQSTNDAEREDSSNDPITELSCKDLYKSRDSFHALNAKKRSKMVIVNCCVVGGIVALLVVGFIMWRLAIKSTKKPVIVL